MLLLLLLLLLLRLPSLTCAAVPSVDVSCSFFRHPSRTLAVTVADFVLVLGHGAKTDVVFYPSFFFSTLYEKTIEGLYVRQAHYFNETKEKKRNETNRPDSGPKLKAS